MDRDTSRALEAIRRDLFNERADRLAAEERHRKTVERLQERIRSLEADVATLNGAALDGFPSRRKVA
jgi:cob(I)alamin adenosyltransferase